MFDRHYEKYARLIFSIAFNILMNKEEAEEVVQEAFFRLSQNLQKVENHKYWLIRVATNLCNDQYQKRKLRNNYEQDQSHQLQTVFSTISTKLNNVDQIKTILAELDEEDRALLVLRFGQDYEYKDLAETLGIPEGTVKSSLSRLLRKIEDLEINRKLSHG